MHIIASDHAARALRQAGLITGAFLAVLLCCIVESSGDGNLALAAGDDHCAIHGRNHVRSCGAGILPVSESKLRSAGHRREPGRRRRECRRGVRRPRRSHRLYAAAGDDRPGRDQQAYVPRYDVRSAARFCSDRSRRKISDHHRRAAGRSVLDDEGIHRLRPRQPRQDHRRLPGKRYSRPRDGCAPAECGVH